MPTEITRTSNTDHDQKNQPLLLETAKLYSGARTIQVISPNDPLVIECDITISESIEGQKSVTIIGIIRASQHEARILSTDRETYTIITAAETILVRRVRM